jgi:hypothetical protein
MEGLRVAQDIAEKLMGDTSSAGCKNATPVG